MPVHVARVIGRDGEVARLSGLLSETRRGRGSAVFLVGEGGIGKSRLAAEAAGIAVDQRMRVLRGRSGTIGPVVPLRPLSEALMPLFRGGDVADVLADPHLGPYRPVLGRLIPDLAEGHREGSSMVVLGEALLRLLTALGRDRANLLVMEDLHDADTETLAVLEYLIDNVDGLPVMLLGTVRAEECPAMDLARATARRRASTLLRLPLLSRDDVARMVGDCLRVPADEVPDEALERLWNDSVGNPFLVEELLQGMIGNGSLVRSESGWRADGDLRSDVSSALLWGTVRRIDRLGPQGLRLLSAASVLGRRFSLSVLQRMTGIDDHSLLSHLHAGVAAQLVVPDEPAPDWYAFRHPLTVESMLAQLTPASRAALSEQAADAIEALHPELPGSWCPLAAELRAAAGDDARAGRLFAAAGRRALTGGAVGSAITLLDRAERLLASGSDLTARAEALEHLIPALAEAGDFERAFSLTERPGELVRSGLGAPRVAALHTRLAKAAHLAGRWADGNAQIALARAQLGGAAERSHTASVDVTEAYLAVDTPGPERTKYAEKLARRAIEAAEAHGLPAVACEAWQLRGILARERDLDEATAYSRQALRIAERHNLPIHRIYAMSRIGGDRWLADGSTEGLEAVRAEAQRVGAITVVHITDGILYLHAVLGGRQADGARQSDECLATAARLRLGSVARYVLMAKATAAAHRADRAAMERELAEFERWDGSGSPEEPLAMGLAQVFCSLLEEDRARALQELGALSALEEKSPSVFHLAGRHGLGLFLDVLGGAAGRAQYAAVVDTAAGRMRWNRHFVLLAHAALLGREGRPDEALATAREAQELAAPLPLALHLGLRLLGEEAHEAGWGEPVDWLRRAEHYFQRASVPTVASACRALLRQMGASVRQHRDGSDRIPLPLRAQGVTVREYEVFQLLADRPSNKDIARRLHISPRTAEKHVASLIAKTFQDNRDALCDLSATLATSPGPEPA
ncbi:ATP-binding protein [Streptomyces radicis]|uniref:LuxR family transcriptional regulator n=1 Tax=Streptomyces radicis TaxID=1750517 RepID=A0A3A9W729_9ACTN|nr:LuxR family transcriptional regulator [Streptomyces radicis]RKN05094.1 LuxR family transcriptional regulator [Streptomyces radicis]RKN16420.1 LuxR family transcriptional regulator [Streptomyces radicis]